MFGHAFRTSSRKPTHEKWNHKSRTDGVRDSSYIEGYRHDSLGGLIPLDARSQEDGGLRVGCHEKPHEFTVEESYGSEVRHIPVYVLHHTLAYRQSSLIVQWSEDGRGFPLARLSDRIDS